MTEDFKRGAEDFKKGEYNLDQKKLFFNLTDKEREYFYGWTWAKGRANLEKEDANRKES